MRALIRRGEARFEIGERDAGLADFDSAQRLDPTNGFLFWSRANVSRKAGHLKEALADINEAIRIEPTDHYNRSQRGHIRKGLNDFDGAIADYTEAFRLNPASGDALFFSR